MNNQEFKTHAYEMIEYVANYMETITKRDCLPSVKPGYCGQLVPENPPEHKETWEAIMKDLEPVVMEGMAHWNHPHFHAYFPAGNCWPSILGDVFSNATGIIASSWESCPAATELEIIVMDWIAKFFGLPDFFWSNFSNPKSAGGGVIQSSASECIMLSQVAARELGVKKLRKLFPNKPRAVLLSMMVGYANNQNHSSVEKGGIISSSTIRLLAPGPRGAITATALKEAIREDKAKGLYPFLVSTVLGSTGVCVFDDLMEIGPICHDHDVWLHVDGAYAGSSFSCPEMRYLMKGMEYAWSFDTNANKWMLTNFDCSMHWFRYKYLMADPMSGNDASIHQNPIVDYRHWGVPMSRRFRAMKLWLVIRTYGVEGIRKYVRTHIHLAKLFEKFVVKDPRFELPIPTVVGLTSFRLVGPDEATTRLLEGLNTSRKVHMVPSVYRGQWIIRFALCAEKTTDEDIQYAWDMVSEHTTAMVNEYKKNPQDAQTYAELIKAQDVFEKAFARGDESEWDRELSNLAVKSFNTIKTLKDMGQDDLLIQQTSHADEFFNEDGPNANERPKAVQAQANTKLRSMCVIA